VNEPSDAGHPAAFETLAVHAGQTPDPLSGAVMEPIVLATTFAQPEPGKPRRFDYSRSGNPTRAALEACLAVLEGGTHGFAFASGCAAATTLLNMLRPGDHVVCGDDVYGGTYRIFNAVMRPLGVAASFIDLRALANLETAIADHTRMIWLLVAYSRMKLYDLSQLPVLDGERIVGILDESDLLVAVCRDEATFRRPVREFMTSRLTTVPPDAPLESLLPIFDRGMVAIVCEGERFVGLITRIDVLNFLRQQLR
jgi:O-acetylhomoserine/O-acetylserine sulfhydrylase-like pyridoxal-dependent enzyme